MYKYVMWLAGFIRLNSESLNDGPISLNTSHQKIVLLISRGAYVELAQKPAVCEQLPYAGSLHLSHGRADSE